MKKTEHLVPLLGLFFFAGAVELNADQEDYNSGYSEGFKAIQGDTILVPLTPLEPLTPLGSTPYREGILDGVEAGRRDDYQDNDR